MARSLSEVATCFEAIAVRIEKLWIPHVAKTSTFKSTAGWQMPSITPDDVMGMARDISARLTEMAENEPDIEPSTKQYWSTMAAQADEVSRAKLSRIATTVQVTVCILALIR